ncbi:DNA polymerase III subunit beta [Buchnera aphidicola (Kurisakia onigurumii)]|uniref:DNA polymerase III subunit beta n=1 Tax=Buchnera aphidicola TaxID=9 RepID=UPI0031B71B4E
MLKFSIDQKKFLKILQKVSILLIKNNSLSILENILIKVERNILTLTSTNMDTEINVSDTLEINNEEGFVCVSGRKLLSICKSIPEQSIIYIETNDVKMFINSNNSFFELSIVSENKFPILQNFIPEVEIILSQNIIKKMICDTYFSMAVNDVRYYLNGTLLEINKKMIRMVSTDGHRMAISSFRLNIFKSLYSIIIPRKSILELNKLLFNKSEPTKLRINKNNIQVNIQNVVFTSKLIDGQYPDYFNVLITSPKVKISINAKKLKQALLRVSILSDKQFQSVHFYFFEGKIEVTANNESEEIAKEIIQLNYYGEEVKFSINSTYIIDILNNFYDENIILLFNIPVSIIQIENLSYPLNYFVVMPLLL